LQTIGVSLQRKQHQLYFEARLPGVFETFWHLNWTWLMNKMLYLRGNCVLWISTDLCKTQKSAVATQAPPPCFYIVIFEWTTDNCAFGPTCKMPHQIDRI
jgi:hypothetical protein